MPLDEWLRLQLQALPGPALPLSRCKCLDLCPRHGVVVALGGRLAGSKPLHVVKNDDAPERVLAQGQVLTPARVSLAASLGLPVRRSCPGPS